MPDDSDVVKPTSERKKILIAYVPGDLGEAVIQAGLAEASVRACPAVVVNVARSGRAVDRKMIDDSDRQRLVEMAARHGVEMDIVQPVHADPVTAIDDLASPAEFALLVIGIRNRSAVGKFVMGSSAQRLLLDADLPILAIKR